MAGFDATAFPPFSQVLDEIVSTGYDGTELGDWGYLPTDAATLAAELQGRGLALVGALVPLALADRSSHTEGVQTALRTARLLAACADDASPGPFVILADANGTDPMRTANAGRIRPEHGFDGGQWQAFADGASQVARAVRDETGVRTIFHHHCAGFIETPSETARLMDMTDPDLVGLCYDTGHYAYAGGDALAGFRRFRDRIWHIHFKDCHPAIVERSRSEGWDYFAAVKNGVFYGLGGGSVDFPAIIEQMTSNGYNGWVVVEDELPPGMGDARAGAERDRRFLRGLGL
jgi:inosose dehydratase